MIQALTTGLGSAAVAAILGGLTGALGSIATTGITARTTRDRERRARLFSEQKSVYVEYLRVMSELQHQVLGGKHEKRLDPTEPLDTKASIQLDIIASRKIREIHVKVMRALAETIVTRSFMLDYEEKFGPVEDDSEEPEGFGFTASYHSALSRYNEVLEDMKDAMRRDLGA